MRSRAYLGVIVLIAFLGVSTQRAIPEEDLESTIRHLFESRKCEEG